MNIIFIVIFIILLLLLLLLIDVYFRQQAGYKIATKLPGDYIYLIVGNSLEFIGLSPENAFLFARNYANRFKDSYRQWFFGTLILNVIRAHDVEVVLSSSKNIEKSFIYGFLHPFMGTGLLTSGGKKWHQRRKLLTPAFHFNILQQFFPIFKEEAASMVEKLENFGGQTVDVIPLMARFTLNTVCETAMGVKLDTMSKSDEYRENIHKIGVKLLYRLLRPWLYSDFVYKFLGQRFQFDKLCRAVHRFTEKVIKHRRTVFLESQNEVEPLLASDNIYATNKKRYAMLDTLLAAEKDDKIDAIGVREEVDTFMFEGHDTTSSGLIFSLFLLAIHSEVQENVHREIVNTLGDRDIVDLQISDIAEMKYFDCVLKECLRVYPPVTFISRGLTEDWVTEKGVIPPGTVVHIHIYDLHRDPDQFPNPEKFDPDRFLPENVEKRHPFSFIPFSAGPRNCIGQKFANLEMKTLIINILRKFRISTVTDPEDVIFIADLVLRAKTPILIKFESR